MNLKLVFFPLTLIVSVAIFIWIAKPEWESLKDNKQELATLVEKRDKFQSNQQNLQKALNQYQQLDENDKQLIDNAIPFSNDNDDFVAEIYKNVQQSGAFLIDIALKAGKDSAGETARAACLAEQRVAATTGEDVDASDGATTTMAPAFCPPAKKVTTAAIGIVGAYDNIKEFIRMIDIQNRLTVPLSFSIEEMQGGVEEEEVGSNALASSVSFSFYNKEANKGILLSSLLDSNDKILNSLMLGSLNTQAIAAFKDAITSDVFRPVTVQDMGKENIFAK